MAIFAEFEDSGEINLPELEDTEEEDIVDDRRNEEAEA